MHLWVIIASTLTYDSYLAETYLAHNIDLILISRKNENKITGLYTTNMI